MIDGRGLPCNLDAERLVLGSVLLDDTRYIDAAAALEADDFSLEKHRRIFHRMAEIYERGEKIDRVTVANELSKVDELESVDGISYLVSLDDGLPQIPNIDAYIRIVRDKATLRRICYAANNLTEEAIRAESEPEEILAGASTAFLDLAGRSVKSTLVAPSAIIAEGGGPNVYLDRRNRTTGIPSGYAGLDNMLGGFKRGDLYILAARPSMGKSALAGNIAERVALDGGHIVPIFSLEMSKESLLDRMICSRARVDSSKFDRGRLNAEERERVQAAASSLTENDRILIDDMATTGIADIHSKVRKLQARGPVGLVIVDYLQLMVHGKDEFRTAEVSGISRGLKLVAKDCKVPVLALSQLSRACEARNDKRPMLSDLRESGAIEQDADVVAFIYREEVYKPNDESLYGLADLIVAKQRNGPIGPLPMVWLKEFVRFEERARE